MKSYLKLLILFLASIAITIFISPLIASFVPFPLHKIMSRAILVVTFFMFYHYREHLGIENIKSLGLGFDKKWRILFVTGIFTATISIGAVLGLMVYGKVRFFVQDITFPGIAEHIAEYLLAGIAVGVIEECFFRGFVLQSLLKDSSVYFSVFLTSILYALIHYFRIFKSVRVDVLDLETSTRVSSLFFKSFSENLPNVWPSVIGLFLLGILLSVAYLRTGSLALSIGLHAGFVLGVKTISCVTDVTPPEPFWGGDVVANPIAWGALVILSLVIVLSMRHKDANKILVKKV